jgi:hypothetical protein
MPQNDTNQLNFTAVASVRWSDFQNRNLFSSDEVAFKKSNRYADLDM